MGRYSVIGDISYAADIGIVSIPIGILGWMTGHTAVPAFFLQNRALPDIRCTRFQADSERAVWSAAIAQLVEHVIRNDGVTGSSPVCGTSIFHSSNKTWMAGYRRAEATPYFGRLWPGHDESVELLRSWDLLLRNRLDHAVHRPQAGRG